MKICQKNGDVKSNCLNNAVLGYNTM